MDVTSMFSGDAGPTASVVLPDPFFVNEGEGGNWGPGSKIVALYYGPRTCRHFMQLAEVDGDGRTTFREVDGPMMRRAAPRRSWERNSPRDLEKFRRLLIEI